MGKTRSEEQTHTPGPWDGIGKDLIPGHYIVWRSNYNDAVDTSIIATGIERKVDARLIAAAPIILGALQHVARVLESKGKLLLDEDIIQAAIAAATEE